MYSLQYTDDVIQLAQEERGLELMLQEMKRYLEKKGLEISIEKTKVMRYRRKKGKGICR